MATKFAIHLPQCFYLGDLFCAAPRADERDGMVSVPLLSMPLRRAHTRLARRRVEMECEGRCREAARPGADPALEMGPETALSYSKGKFSCDINVVPRAESNSLACY
jgi:hypothetical protein